MYLLCVIKCKIEWCCSFVSHISPFSPLLLNGNQPILILSCFYNTKEHSKVHLANKTTHQNFPVNPVSLMAKVIPKETCEVLLLSWNHDSALWSLRLLSWNNLIVTGKGRSFPKSVSPILLIRENWIDCFGNWINWCHKINISFAKIISGSTYFL